MWILGKHSHIAHLGSSIRIICNETSGGNVRDKTLCHSLLKNARQMKFIVPHEHTPAAAWLTGEGVVLSQEWAQCTQCHFTISLSGLLSIACLWIWHWIVLLICSLITLLHHRIINRHKDYISGESVNVSCSGKTHQHECVLGGFFRTGVYKPVSRERFGWKQYLKKIELNYLNTV